MDIDVTDLAQQYILKKGGKLTIDMKLHHTACG